MAWRVGSSLTPGPQPRHASLHRLSPDHHLKISAGDEASGLSRFSPDVNTFAQWLAPMFAHLLAAVALAGRQYKNSLHIESYSFGNVGEDQVDGDACAGIANVVINHKEGGTVFQYSQALCNHTSHLVKIASHHSGDSVIVQFAARLLILQVCENCLQ